MKYHFYINLLLTYIYMTITIKSQTININHCITKKIHFNPLTINFIDDLTILISDDNCDHLIDCFMKYYNNFMPLIN